MVPPRAWTAGADAWSFPERELPELSRRAIDGMCGLGPALVSPVRRLSQDDSSRDAGTAQAATRQEGKQSPAKKKATGAKRTVATRLRGPGRHAHAPRSTSAMSSGTPRSSTSRARCTEGLETLSKSAASA